MTDYFKVALNEADRRIKMEVHLKALIEAVEQGDEMMLNLTKNIAKEAFEEAFDKYEGAETA